MPFPARLLTEGEEIVNESKQHWIALRDEIGYTFAWLVLWIIVVPWLDFALDEWIAWILTLAWAGVAGLGVARWYSTDLIITTRRLIYRKGVMEKSGYEVELSRLLDVGFRQSFWQGLVGAGDLLLDTGGHEGRAVINDVSEPGRLTSILEDVRTVAERRRPPSRLPGESAPVESQSRSSAPQRPDRPPGPPSGARLTRAEQLEILAKLHTDGKLTDEEFMLEKRRVLESN